MRRALFFLKRLLGGVVVSPEVLF
jgi:hypothetical protein